MLSCDFIRVIRLNCQLIIVIVRIIGESSCNTLKPFENLLYLIAEDCMNVLSLYLALVLDKAGLMSFNL